MKPQTPNLNLTALDAFRHLQNPRSCLSISSCAPGTCPSPALRFLRAHSTNGHLNIIQIFGDLQPNCAYFSKIRRADFQNQGAPLSESDLSFIRPPPPDFSTLMPF